MGNSRTRSVNYTPRMTGMEAFDKLPSAIKHALETATIEWDAYGVYRYWQKCGNVQETIRWIRYGDAEQAKRAWFPSKGFKGKPGYKPGMPNPCVSLGIKPLFGNY